MNEGLEIPQEFQQKQIPLKDRINKATKWYLKECTKNPQKFNKIQKENYDKYMSQLTRNMLTCFLSPLFLRYILRKTPHANKLCLLAMGANSMYFGFQIYQNHLELNNFVFQEFIN